MYQHVVVFPNNTPHVGEWRRRHFVAKVPQEWQVTWYEPEKWPRKVGLREPSYGFVVQSFMTQNRLSEDEVIALCRTYIAYNWTLNYNYGNE